MWEEQAWRGVKVCPCACTREFKVWKQNRDRNLVWGAGEIVLGCGVVEEKRSKDCPGLYHLEGRELRTGQESELPEPALGAEAAESCGVESVGFSSRCPRRLWASLTCPEPSEHPEAPEYSDSRARGDHGTWLPPPL